MPMNTYASDALQGLTPFELVFIRKPRTLLGYKFKPLDEYPVAIRHYIQLLQDRANFLRKRPNGLENKTGKLETFTE